MERELAFKALVGSKNYNLNTPESDTDYKVFVLPTLKDLFEGNEYKKSKDSEDSDYTLHDVRKLVNVFWKSNVNFIEVLYSSKAEITEVYHIKEKVNDIFAMRDEIVTMNLPYLYRACKGMYFNKSKMINKGTDKTMHLIDRYGYDTKQAMAAYRIMDFIERFKDTDFKDFTRAMRYDEDERRNMLKIKNGEYSEDEFRKNLLNPKFESFTKIESVYEEKLPREDVKEELEKAVYQMVESEIHYNMLGQ